MPFLRFLKLKRDKEKYWLALDIGTEFVKALVFEIDKDNQKGYVKGLSRVRQEPTYMQAGAVADIQGVVKVCQEALRQVVRQTKVMPTRVVLGIAGEFVKGSTTSLVYKRENPEERIDLTELKNIVQKIQWKAFEQIRKELSWEMARPEVEIKLISAHISEVQIDGYKISNPLGFQGKEVLLRIFNVYAPLVHLGALQSIANQLNLDLFSIVAEPYALARALDIKSAICIDLGGGTTDIALVQEGGVKATRSLSLGGRTFTKKLVKTLGLGFIEAEEVKLKYSQKKLSPAVQKKIREIFKKDILVWLNGINLALEDFSQVDFFPSKILLSGGGSLLPGIKSALERESRQHWSQKMVLARPLQVEFIRPKDIVNIVDQKHFLKDPQDIMPMALASLALEELKDQTILNLVLKRAVRIIQK